MANDADSQARTALRPLDLVTLTAFREYEAAFLAAQEGKRNLDREARACVGAVESPGLGGLRSAYTRAVSRLSAAFAALNEAIGAGS